MNACFRDEKKLRLQMNRDRPSKPWFPVKTDKRELSQTGYADEPTDSESGAK